jgi:hypothetical protein
MVRREQVEGRAAGSDWAVAYGLTLCGADTLVASLEHNLPSTVFWRWLFADKGVRATQANLNLES